MQEEEQRETTVFFWGKFKEQKQPIPTEIVQLSKNCISRVQSGGFFYLAANGAGELWAWGTTKHCRFGLDKPEFIHKPQRLLLKFKVNQIAAGNWHSMITDSGGNLYGVGHNKFGSLGLFHFDNTTQFSKVPVSFPVQQVTAGDSFTIIISDKGQMYGTGHNSFHGHKNKDNLNQFKRIGGQVLFRAVNAGFTHALAVSQQGQVYSWGEGNFYQLGHGNKNDVKTPTLIQTLKQVKIESVSCTRGQKYAHSMASTVDGRVYTWGSGYKGKLGHFSEWTHADPADQPVPRLMDKLDAPVIKVMAGGIHSGVLTQGGQIMTFGCGSDGRIGHIESNDHRYLYREGLPRKIETLDAFSVIDGSFSYYHNICVASRREK